ATSRGTRTGRGRRRRRTGSRWAARVSIRVGTRRARAGFRMRRGCFRRGGSRGGGANKRLFFGGRWLQRGGGGPGSGAEQRRGGQVEAGRKVDGGAGGVTAWQKTIARALQVYGMYGMDSGGAVAIMSESADSGDGLYPWDGSPFGYLPSELAKHLRVLAYGPQ